MVLILQKIWSFTSKNWRSITVALALVVLTFAAWKTYSSVNANFSSQLAAYQRASDEEMLKVIAAQREERAQHEANIKQLQDTLTAVQQQYDEAKLALEAKKKAAVTQIVTKYADDPEGLAKKLSEVTGFKVVMP